MRSSQILAVSGILTGDRARTRDLISYAVSLAGTSGPARFCFIPTAEGDNPLVVEWFEDAFGNDPSVDASVLTLFTSPDVPDVRKHLLAHRRPDRLVPRLPRCLQQRSRLADSRYM